LEPNSAPVQGFGTLQELQELWLGEALSSKFDKKSGTKTDTVIFLPSHLVNPSLFIVRPTPVQSGPCFSQQAAAPAIIVEENSFLSELLFEQPIFGAKVIDGVLISTIDPAGEDQKQQLPWLQEVLHAPPGFAG
jgi:hypothetical protein